MDSSIDRVYKYLENEVIPKMDYESDLVNYIVENIYNNLVISLDTNITKKYIGNRLSNIENYKKQLPPILFSWRNCNFGGNCLSNCLEASAA